MCRASDIVLQDIRHLDSGSILTGLINVLLSIPLPRLPSSVGCQINLAKVDQPRGSVSVQANDQPRLE